MPISGGGQGHRHSGSDQRCNNTPDARFDHIHFDIIGPVPPSTGYIYLLTCVDQFTHWPEAFPIADISAKTAARTFVYVVWHALVFHPLCQQTVDGSLNPPFDGSRWNSWEPNEFKPSHTILLQMVSSSVSIANSRQLSSRIQTQPAG